VKEESVRTKREKTKKKEVHKIAPPLLPLKVPIGMLNLDPKNARDHGEQNIGSIVASLDEFGQRKCIVVKKDGMTVSAGNGTVTAAKQLGWTHIAALVTDDNEVTAMAYALADNRTGELATWDYERLVRSMTQLNQGGIDLKKLGWDAVETRMLMQLDSTSFEDMRRLDVDATLNNSMVSGLMKGGKGDKNEFWFYVEFYKDEPRFRKLLKLLQPYMRTPHEMTREFFAAMVERFFAEHGKRSEVTALAVPEKKRGRRGARA
jgi:hypothetical protein